MAPLDGTKVSYGDANIIRNVDQYIEVMSPTEVAFLKAITGGSKDKPGLNKLMEACESTKYEWMEHTDPPLSTTLNAAIVGGGDATITLQAAFLPFVQEGMILLIESEQLLVGAYSGSGTVPVTRGWGSTTAAAHANSTPVYVIGRAHKEGGLAPRATPTYPIFVYNLVQEFVDTIKLSHIEQAIKRYGIARALEYETGIRTRQLFISMAQQIWYGKRVQGDDNNPTTFGGIETFVAASHVFNGNGSTQLTATHIADAIQASYDDTGPDKVPNLIVTNSKLRRRISTIYAQFSGVTNFREADKQIGGVVIDTIKTDFGEIGILVDQWCPQQNLLLTRLDKLGFGPLAGNNLTRQPLAKVGTSDQLMISGAYTFEARASKSHSFLKGYIP